ncbi:MAG TPA: N-formylglutamate deformylase [Rhizomicrobium sp.]|nr:N-formylglutamate deformylase [Rhizomicrobium sp.]
MTEPIVQRGNAPLIISMPHAGTDIPEQYQEHIISLWRAKKDADYWIDRLYSFATGLDATIVRTAISRTVIDVNRDPSGRSLYPGKVTTELCPTTTFDGEPLYRSGHTPTAADIARRRDMCFTPYHDALIAEIERLRAAHKTIVLFDAHSIRSRIPRLFDGELPNLNFGTNDGVTCAPALIEMFEALSVKTRFSRVTNGRFKGGYITRHYGRPGDGVHAVQLELAMRGYMLEPPVLTEQNWPSPYQRDRAAPLRALLAKLLQAAIDFASKDSS